VPMSSSLDKAIDLKQYWRMIWRRKGLVLLCTIATISTAVVALVFVPKEYESQVTLMVEESQSLSAGLKSVMGGLNQGPSGYGSEGVRLSQLVGRIRSRPFLERVVRLLKMNEDPVVRAQAAEKLRKQPELSVDEMASRMLVGNLQSRIRFGSPGSGLYNITVADYSPGNAQLLAKWISELFVDVSSQTSLDRLRAAHDFGVEQTKIYEEQLRRSEEKLGNFKKSLVEQAQARRTVRNENLPRAESVHDLVIAEINEARNRVATSADSVSTRRLDRDYADLAGEPRIRDLAGRLSSALKDELIRGLDTPGETGGWPPTGDYPVLRVWLLQEIERQAAGLHPEAGSEAASLAARSVFARIDLEVLEQGAELLGGAIASCRRQAQSGPEDEIELARLDAQVESNRKLLESFRGQLVASDVSQAAEMTSLGLKMEILDPASLPLAPSRPDKKKILLASLFLGPLIGVAIAFMSETLDPTLRSLEDFTRIMPEPILGTTPLLTRLPIRGGWLRRNWIMVSVVGVLLLAAVGFVARTTLLNSLVTSGRPVEMAEPKELLHENR
jgi:polysaccharide biosynthesis transport protein